MEQFFTSWPAWAEVIFVFFCLALLTVLVALAKKRYEQRRLREYATAVERDRQTGRRIYRLIGNVPFGIRALEGGIEVPDIWISRHNTPDPTSYQGHRTAHLTPTGGHYVNLDEQGRRHHQRWGSNPYTLRGTGNAAQGVWVAEDQDGPASAQESMTGINIGESDTPSARLLPESRTNEEANRPTDLELMEARRESQAAETGQLGLTRRNAVRIRSRGFERPSRSDASSDETNDSSPSLTSSSYQQEGSSLSDQESETTPPSTLPRIADVTPFTQFRQLVSLPSPSPSYQPLHSDDEASADGTARTRPSSVRSLLTLRPAYLGPSAPPPPRRNQNVLRHVGRRIFRREHEPTFEMITPTSSQTQLLPRSEREEQQTESSISLQHLTSEGRRQSSDE